MSYIYIVCTPRLKGQLDLAEVEEEEVSIAVCVAIGLLACECGAEKAAVSCPIMPPHCSSIC